jgi:aminoglycoside phosphotransferase (APT) family kinase protein
VPTSSPEIVVDQDLALRLISSQFRDLEITSLRLLGEGMDNTVWAANELFAFRFPRREVAVPFIRREITALPLLAPVLPLPVPVPIFVGSPSENYPWPFFGGRLVVGSEPADLQLTDHGRVQLARALGSFLRELHSPAVLELVQATVELAHDRDARGDMRRRVPRAREALTEAGRNGLWEAPSAISRLFDVAITLPPTDAIAVVHGDLDFRHVLIRTDGELAGVIDWGAIGRANPCVDFVLYWCLIPPAGRSLFLEAYGPVPEDDLLRARVLALSVCAMLANFAKDREMNNLEHEAVKGLSLAASD